MITLADYVIDFLVKKDLEDIFLVSGGGIMYLTDSVGRNKKIRYIANYHEQASATAAEAYARMKENFGACLVTTGPGSTNAITGVAGAWVDSIPLFVISGQVKRELISDYSVLRQKGPQEANIIDMVKPITKYAVTVMEPEKIRFELEKAFYLMKEGRPGPVWINIPLDIQGSMINVERLSPFVPTKSGLPTSLRLRGTGRRDKKSLKIKEVLNLLKKSQRPLIIAGNGIRLSGGKYLFVKLINQLDIPVVLPINGLDLLEEDNPLLIGKFGPFGQRRGNFALQNTDLILSIGASLNVASIGFNIKGFAPRAKKIMVNIDRGELDKDTLEVDLKIVADCSEFIQELLSQVKNTKFNFTKKWHEACRYWKKKYPNLTADYYKDKNHVNSYVFFDQLSDLLTFSDVVTTGIALDAVSLYQAFKVKKNQRAFVNKNYGQMGWSLPATVGTNVANNRKRTICVTGDGSLMVNVHELQTISHYKLPIKIFVFDNKGYESIRYTQNNLFEGRLVGSDEKTGVTNPDFKFLAKAHNLPYEKINNNNEIVEKVRKILNLKGPVLCEVNINPKQRRMPRISSYRRPDGVLESKPLEDMWPFLPEEEVYENMHMFDNKSKLKIQKSKMKVKTKK